MSAAATNAGGTAGEENPDLVRDDVKLVDDPPPAELLPPGAEERKEESTTPSPPSPRPPPPELPMDTETQASMLEMMKEMLVDQRQEAEKIRQQHQKEMEDRNKSMFQMTETMAQICRDQAEMAKRHDEERFAVRALIQDHNEPSRLPTDRRVHFDDEPRTPRTPVTPVTPVTPEILPEGHLEHKSDDAKKAERKRRKKEKKKSKKYEDSSDESIEEVTTSSDDSSLDINKMSESDSESDDDKESKKKSKSSSTKVSHFPSLPDRDENQCTKEEYEDFTRKAKLACECSRDWIKGEDKIAQACKGKTFAKELALIQRRIMEKNEGKIHAKIAGFKRGTRRKKKAQLYQAVFKQIVLQQLKVINRSTILARDKSRTVEEMQHLYMRECAAKIDDVTVDCYMAYFLTHYAEQKDDPWTMTALLKSLPAILRERVKLRVQVGKRTQDRVFMTLRELERDFTTADRQIYRDQLAAQGDLIDRLGISKSSAKYKGTRRPGAGKDKRVAFIADSGEAFYDAADPSTKDPPRELKTCFKCGHRHWGDKSPCPSGPKDEKAIQKAKDEMKKTQKERDKNRKTKTGYFSKSEVSKWLEKLENSRQAFRADNPTADSDDERNHMEATKKELGLGCMCCEILEKIHDDELDDLSELENLAGDAFSLRDLVQNVKGGSTSIKHGLQKEGCLYDPIVLVNGTSARALSAVADGGADAPYMGLDHAKILAKEGLLVFVVQMKNPKKLNGISGQVEVRWYVGVYEDRGFGPEPVLYQLANIGMLILNGRPEHARFGAILNYDTNQMMYQRYGHALSFVDGEPFFVHSEVKKDPVMVQCFTSSEEARQHAEENILPKYHLDAIPIPKSPLQVLSENSKGVSKPFLVIDKRFTEKSFNVQSFSLPEWHRLNLHAEKTWMNRTTSARLVPPRDLGPGDSTLVDLQLDDPLIPGEAFQAISAGIDQVVVSKLGVSSRNPTDPRHVIAMVTNSSEIPVRLTERSTSFEGGIVNSVDEVNIDDGTAHIATRTTTTTPDDEVDADLPESVETANTSTRHAELQEKARTSFSKLSLLRLTFTWVAILCSGIGGMTNGIMMANKAYGTSFRVSTP